MMNIRSQLKFFNISIEYDEIFPTNMNSLLLERLSNYYEIEEIEIDFQESGQEVRE